MNRIEKTQTSRNHFLRHNWFYPAARVAMEDFLVQAAYHLKPRCASSALRILLPSYIGVSPKEGSGIFDPIIKLRDEGLIDPLFYKMNDGLYIDIPDVLELVESSSGQPFILLKVNYFGFTDPNEQLLFDIVKNFKGYVLEDNAHGFFTYQARFEHFCDAAFFSLHKQFPFSQGGMLVTCNEEFSLIKYTGSPRPLPDENPFTYDIQAISAKCRSNFEIVDTLAKKYLDLWIPLRSLHTADITVPQTYPLVLQNSNRYQVYLDLNKQGYGVTSLYHTLIEPLQNNPRYASSRALADRILNIPVHQDVDTSLYTQLIDNLAQSCRVHALSQ